jgi:threonyl-tRNA synthetase
MNCAHHILVFAAELKTARDVPYRLAELGTMSRMERSGVLGGLSRVRQMTLNDAHIFCTAEQVESEVAAILALVEEAYGALSIPPPSLRLSLKDAGAKYIGDAALWERSETMLRSGLQHLGRVFDEVEGEAAFYGPKIDLQVTDPQGREETLSTIQLDFHLPARFGLSFQRGPDREQPVMIHRSLVSTMERMVAHLLEVHNGALPVWLAPTQVTVVPIVTDAVAYGGNLRDLLRRGGLRVELDDRDATLGSRIRSAEQRHVPFIAIVGRREVEEGTVSDRLRTRQSLALGVGEFATWVSEAVVARSLHGAR